MTDSPAVQGRSLLLHQLVDAIQVAPAGEDVFTAVSPDWWGERVFGGMVLAQVLNAAIRTTPADGGLPPHSVHGYFLRAVRPGSPVTLEVEHLRDSRSFATRQVSASQDGRLTSRFACSFHAAEDGPEYQVPMPDVPSPDEGRADDGQPVDGQPVDGHGPPGPFDVVDLGPLRNADGTFSSSGRWWVRTCGRLPDDPALHGCALAIMSDLTRSSFRPLTLDEWGTHTDASIDHALWLHRPARADEWLFYDLQALVNTGGRSVVRGSMYRRDGQLCMSMAQELLIRPLPGQGGRAPWLGEGP
ncbi:MAG TPA: acyl-CoA thioesterase domain-containing protein [Acidimicrobiales bacterium]|nr:acyl-CoA thioesterase domain-containing protein [Acidimicrobiales bacterium]